MTVLNTGATKNYSENWAQAFAKGSRGSAAKTKAGKQTSPGKKSAKKKAARRAGRKSKA